MEKVLRVGIIGTGFLATHNYLPAYQKLTNARIVAAADPDLGRARHFADRYGGVDTHQDYRELLARPDVDAVNIITPPASHAPITVASARAGKHIMCEKPLAMNVAEADEMVAAARKAGVRLMVGYQPRLSPLWIRVKELLDAGLIGKLLCVTLYATELHQGYRRWFFDRQVAGGGVLMDGGVYETLALLYWFGPIKSVYARLAVARSAREAEGEQLSGIQTEDVAAISVEFEQGGFGMIHRSYASAVGGRHIFIDGTEGAIAMNTGLVLCRGPIRVASTRIDDPAVLVPLMSDTGELDQGAKGIVTKECPWHEVSIPELTIQDQHDRKVAAFVDCCLNDTEPPVTGEDGLASLEVVQAAYESSKEGRPITLPLPR